MTRVVTLLVDRARPRGARARLAARPGRRRRRPRPARPRRARRRPTDRGMFVSVLDKNGAPVTGLTAGRLRRAGGPRRPRGPSRRAGDRADHAGAARRQLAGRHAVHRGHPPGPQAVRQAAGRQEPDGAHGVRRAPVDHHQLHARRARRSRRASTACSRSAGSGSYLLQAVEEICKGLAKRDFERAVILAITAGGPEFSDRHYDAGHPGAARQRGDVRRDGHRRRTARSHRPRAAQP